MYHKNSVLKNCNKKEEIELSKRKMKILIRDFKKIIHEEIIIEKEA